MNSQEILDVFQIRKILFDYENVEICENKLILRENHEERRHFKWLQYLKQTQSIDINVLNTLNQFVQLYHQIEFGDVSFIRI